MIQNIQIPEFKDLDEILHERLVEKAQDALAHQHDDEDIDDAVINGLDDQINIDIQEFIDEHGSLEQNYSNPLPLKEDCYSAKRASRYQLWLYDRV